MIDLHICLLTHVLLTELMVSVRLFLVIRGHINYCPIFIIFSIFTDIFIFVVNELGQSTARTVGRNVVSTRSDERYITFGRSKTLRLLRQFCYNVNFTKY